jgi:proteic killer suppression protein
MEVRYENRNLQKLCTDEQQMRRERIDIAPKLRLRIAALKTATTIADLVALDPLGNWHPLTADRAGTWAGSLSRNWRLVIRPEGEGLVVAAVEVTVVEIVDYH